MKRLLLISALLLIGCDDGPYAEKRIHSQGQECISVCANGVLSFKPYYNGMDCVCKP